MKAATNKSLLLHFHAFWSLRNTRERCMLASAAAVIVLGLIYGLLIDPALAGRAELRAELPKLHQQAAQMRSLAHEAAALAGKNHAGTSIAITQQGIEASLAGKSLRAQNISVTGDAVRIRLSAVSYSTLIGWLDEMQRTSRLAVTEANFKALEQNGSVDATLTMRQPKND